VIRDRVSLAREVEGGRIENVYRVQLMNTEERHRNLALSAVGDKGEPMQVLMDGPAIELPPLGTRMVLVRVRAEPREVRGSEPIRFVLESRDPGGRAFTIREKSRFLYP
jgi:polyferredoxin